MQGAWTLGKLTLPLPAQNGRLVASICLILNFDVDDFGSNTGDDCDIIN